MTEKQKIINSIENIISKYLEPLFNENLTTENKIKISKCKTELLEIIRILEDNQSLFGNKNINDKKDNTKYNIFRIYDYKKYMDSEKTAKRKVLFIGKT